MDQSSIPIDIHANKLLDWLISRHHCNKDWVEKISIVRKKINEALEDMPESEKIAKILLEASPLTYYHCLKIIEVLRETEADSKNIFGMYGSRRMKDWADIIKLYQKDNLHLAECASILGRNVTYEIPAMRRLTSKLEQSAEECLKKKANCIKGAQDLKDKFLSSATALGLKFENFASKTPTTNSIGFQMVSQMKVQLPVIFRKITEKTEGVRPAADFYKKFLQATIGLTDAQDRNCLSVLSTIIKKGNVTTYEWIHGEAPVKIELPELDYSFTEDDENSEEADIDFGDVVTLENEGNGEIVLEEGDIDWGEIGGDSDGVNNGESIDFNVDLDVSGIVLERDGIEGGVARNEEALTLLENSNTRNHFIDDLYELQGFLRQRIEETKNESSGVSMIFSDNDEALRSDNLEQLLSSVNSLLSIFNENATKQYLLIRESKRFISRLAESLLHHLKLSAKMEHTAKESERKYNENIEELKQIAPKIALLTKLSRELQKELVKDISKKYNERPVYISGGV